MTRIRKQPRRPGKKPTQPLTRNIFVENQHYENILPKQILLKLTQVDMIAVGNLQEFVGQPLVSQLSQNLLSMRQALNHQRAKISSLPIHEDFQRMQQMQTQEELRDQTKKTANSLHEYPEQIMMLHSQDDNILFHFDETQNRRRALEHEQLMQLDDRHGAPSVQEEIDIFSLIN